MIQYSLVCDSQHKFDAWFRNAEAYDQQAARGILTCPFCSSKRVDKALMAPAVSTRSGKTNETFSAGHPDRAKLVAAMRSLREQLTSNAEYVGDRFAEEARKIHDDEAEMRGIYGEATREEVTALAEDGIEFMPLPILPEEQN